MATSNSIVVDSFNSIITDTIVNVLSTCRVDSTFDQNIHIRCTNNQLREANEYCLHLLRNFDVDQYDTQLSVDSSNFQRVVQDFQMALSNITLNSCKGCFFDNIQQSMLFNLDSSCELATLSENIVEAATAQTVDNTLDNHGDLLSGLAGVFGFTSTNQIKQELSTRIATLVRGDILTETLTQVNAYQNISIDGTDDVRYIHQNTMVDVVSTIVASTDISTQVLSQSEWEIMNMLINSQTSISDIGEMTLTGLSVFNALAETVMGRVVLAVCIIAGFVMLMFFIMNAVVYGPDVWNNVFVKPSQAVHKTITT